MRAFVLASMIFVSMTSLATAEGGNQNSAGKAGGLGDGSTSNFGGVVSGITRGANISTAFSGNNIPNDPVRGAYVRSVIDTVPGNPVRQILDDPPGLGD